jgi:peptide deformylase
MIRRILELGHPMLQTRTERLTDLGQARRVLADLRDTLYDFRDRRQWGRAISAPQIGEPVRVTFMHVDRPVALVNPVITVSTGTLEYWDDCFSFPELFVWVGRAARINLEYQDEEGRPHVLEAEGALAELLQHEVDHLDGVLAIERAKDNRSFCLRGEFVRQKKGKWVR